MLWAERRYAIDELRHLGYQKKQVTGCPCIGEPLAFTVQYRFICRIIGWPSTRNIQEHKRQI